MRALLAFLLTGALAFAGAPKRVVSQTAGTDEMLMALADPGQIAALSVVSRNPDYCTDAAKAAAFPQLAASDAEAILRFHPDLVLMASFSRPETVAQLRRAGVPVLVIDHFDTLEDTLGDLRLIGKAVGHGDRAESLIASLRARVDALMKRLAGATPLRVMAPSAYGYIAGRDTTFDDLCGHAGAVNVAAEAGLKGHAPIPAEKVLVWKVDRLVLEGADRAAALARVRQIAPFKYTDAAIQGRCVLLPEALLSTVSQHRVDAYEALAKALHPDRFP
ncbi:MAG TPA: ABC transporter substrate-binding protein [Holophagaceae bacterium]|jgi:iron complex transport system substrate-binding protein|nr:ABC transporter substrate-binding protein [Holophagaceae bacterium]